MDREVGGIVHRRDKEVATTCFEDGGSKRSWVQRQDR